MFIFSVYPMHFFSDSDAQRVNLSNTVDVAEHNVMQLEALFTSMILGQYYDGAASGVMGNTSIQQVSDVLELSRNNHLSLMQEQNKVADNNSSNRLGYVQFMTKIADERVADLEELQTALNNGERLNRFITGVDNNNYYHVSSELNRAKFFRHEVVKAEAFWNKVVETKVAITENKEEESGSVDISIDRINSLAKSKVILQDLMKLKGINVVDETAEQLKAHIKSIQQRIDDLKSKAKRLNEDPKKNKDELETIQGQLAILSSELASLKTKEVSTVVSSLMAEALQSQINTVMKEIN